MGDAYVLGVHQGGVRLQDADKGWVWDAPFGSDTRAVWAWVSGSDPSASIGDGEQIDLLDDDDDRSNKILAKPGMAVRAWPDAISRDGIVLAVGPSWCVVRADDEYDDEEQGRVFAVSFDVAQQLHAVVNSAGDAVATPWLPPRSYPPAPQSSETDDVDYPLDGEPALIFDAPRGVDHGE